MFMVFEWHLVWAAGSGMETLLFALLALIVLQCLIQFDDRLDLPQTKIFLVIGAIIGLSVWVRPDGMTLIGPSIFVVIFNSALTGKKSAIISISGFGIWFRYCCLFTFQLDPCGHVLA